MNEMKKRDNNIRQI